MNLIIFHLSIASHDVHVEICAQTYLFRQTASHKKHAIALRIKVVFYSNNYDSVETNDRNFSRMHREIKKQLINDSQFKIMTININYISFNCTMI